MLSPSQGFCYCLPVRLGALVVSSLAFVGSGILAGVTFRSLATISAHITSMQTAGFYLASVSWASLSLFSLLGVISVIIQHPLLLTIFARFIIYHIPASLLCNLFFTVALFDSYTDIDVFLRSAQCSRRVPSIPVCGAFASLQTLTWAYIFILLPASIIQSYVYVVIKRFNFVVSGEWALEEEENMERQRRSMGNLSNRQRRTTVTQTIGQGGRRRAKAKLCFTMETTGADADDSFLPSMILSPMNFTSSPRTPGSMSSTAPLLIPFMSPRLGQETSTRPAGSPTTPVKKSKDSPSERSARMSMDFSDPEPVNLSPQPGQWLKPVTHPQPDPFSRDQEKGKARDSDASVYSVGSIRDASSGSS